MSAGACVAETPECDALKNFSPRGVIATPFAVSSDLNATIASDLDSLPSVEKFIFTFGRFGATIAIFPVNASKIFTVFAGVSSTRKNGPCGASSSLGDCRAELCSGFAPSARPQTAAAAVATANAASFSVLNFIAMW